MSALIRVRRCGNIQSLFIFLLLLPVLTLLVHSEARQSSQGDSRSGVSRSCTDTHTHTYKGVLLISLFQQPALANKSSGWNHLLCCDAPDEKMQRQREPDCECEGGRVCEGGSDGEHGKKGRKGGHALCVSAHLYSKPVCLSIFLFHTPSILLSLHLPPLHLSIQPCPFLSWEPGLNITVKRSERMLQTKEMVSEVWESFSGAGFGSGSAIDDY